MHYPPHKSSFALDPDIATVLPQFIAGLPATVAQLRAFAAQNHAEELRRRLHQLKGAGKSYGFEPISTLAGGLEDLLLAQRPLAELLSRLDELLEYMESVEGYSPR